MELGAADFIAKPFIADDFLERVAFYTKAEFGQSDVFNEGADANAQRLGNATKGDQ